MALPSRAITRTSRLLSPCLFTSQTTSQSLRPVPLLLRTSPTPMQRYSFSSTPTAFAESNQHPQKSAQEHRDQINPEANEYAKSGTDDQAAGQEEAAFNPNITDPQHAKEKAGEGNQVNPLDASPANPDISQTTEEESPGVARKHSEGGGKGKK